MLDVRGEVFGVDSKIVVRDGEEFGVVVVGGDVERYELDVLLVGGWGEMFFFGESGCLIVREG